MAKHCGGLWCCSAQRSSPLGARKFALSVVCSLLMCAMTMKITNHRICGCPRCSRRIRVCRSCDYGQRYCSVECSTLTRQERRRETARRYRQTEKGQLSTRLRQQRFRRKARDVTHQGAASSGQTRIRVSLKDVQQKPIKAVHRAHDSMTWEFCPSPGSTWVRFRFLNARFP